VAVAVAVGGRGVVVGVGVVGGVELVGLTSTSNAPMSLAGPWGRATPRWSVVRPAETAGFAGRSTCSCGYLKEQSGRLGLKSMPATCRGWATA